MFAIDDLPEDLSKREYAPLLSGILRGIERESLRITPAGELSQRAHPNALGSALTHPYITTDFSEALLEFITPPTHRIADLFCHLDTVHRFAAAHIGDEVLWANSMPCKLPDEEDIPVGRYGSSHNGTLKTVYRKGLGLRYGRRMQAIAGVHYNFSLPNTFWAHFHAREHSMLSLEEYKNQRYFGLIRNFRRHQWILILLFGASPAICSCFIEGQPHDLHSSDDGQTLYRPYATSLRMGDLGYQSRAQKSLMVCYNHKETYINTLVDAILNPYPAYSDMALKDASGRYQQLSQGLLQIENEFYSSIRPKRSAKPGETALTALHRRGIEYIELRCLDNDPFTPLGIDAERVHFLDVFLLYCALADSPKSDERECKMILDNQKRVVNEGRKPGLHLKHAEFGELALEEWLTHFLHALQPVADILDKANDDKGFSEALERQINIAKDLNQTPSAKLLEQMSQTGSYQELSLHHARKNTEHLKAEPLSDLVFSRYAHQAEESLAEQTTIEQSSVGRSFDDFLGDYFKQYQKLKNKQTSSVERSDDDSVFNAKLGH